MGLALGKASFYLTFNCLYKKEYQLNRADASLIYDKITYNSLLFRNTLQSATIHAPIIKHIQQLCGKETKTHFYNIARLLPEKKKLHPCPPKDAFYS